MKETLDFKIATVAPGSIGRVELDVPHGYRFFPSRLVIPYLDNGDCFALEEFRIGETDLLEGVGPVPAGIFAETAMGLIRGLGAPDAPKRTIALVARNNGVEPRELVGVFEGYLVREKEVS